MLTFSPTTQSVRLQDAQVGDVFYARAHAGFSGYENLDIRKVVRVTARDVVCQSDTGREVRFAKSKIVAGYLDGSPELAEVMAKNKFLELRSNALRILDQAQLGGGAKIDLALIKALEAFEKRMQRADARKDTA
jgi:hypothetical protein